MRSVMPSARALANGIKRRPLVAVFAIALGARVIVATAITLLTDSFVVCDFVNGATCDSHSLVPDENLY